MKRFNLFVLILTVLCSQPFFGENINSLNPSNDDSLKIVEKVYLHIDRDNYYPGDDIWFKAYLINASNRLLSNHSNNLHVELISTSFKIIESRVVRLNEGLGNGDFILPENLQSGRYRIRAYTNYMRNFGENFSFSKDITIINSSDSIKVISDSIKYIKNKLEISFYPEGGSLVDNVTSNIAFKAVNALGAGCDVSGEIYSTTGEMINIFKSTHKGMGTFSIKPVPGLSYYALAKNQYGDVVKSEIPKSFPTGIAFNVTRNQNNELVVTVRTNMETLPLILDHNLSLTVSAHKISFKTAVFRMKSLADRFILPTDNLPDGIVMLTLSGLDSIPFCERLLYIQNNEDIKVNLGSNKTVYNQRDSVAVKISLSGNSGMGQEAFLSLSATENIYLNNSSQFPSTISSWFLLESDVRGPVEEPSYYFDTSNPDRLKDLDLLLLTQGWRDFEWKYEKMIYLPESGFIVSGRLRKLLSNVPLKNSKVNIGIFKDGIPVISTVPTDSSGRFYLGGIDLTGEAKLVVSAIGEKEHLQGKLFLDSVRYSPAKIQYNIAQTKLFINNNQFREETLDELKKDAESKKRIRKKYALSDTILLNEVKIVSKIKKEPEINYLTQRVAVGIPENVIKITGQLERYNNVIEIIRKGVSGVNVIPVSDLDESGIRIRGSKLEPLFMLDGINVPYGTISSLPVSWIERIEVLKSGGIATTFGTQETNGVISVITRPRERIISDEPVFHSVNIKISGYNDPRIFYSPNYSSKSESTNRPDLRSTLFWEPNIEVKEGKDFFLNYFNAEHSSIIKVIVEGITTAGIPITSKIEYEVK